MPCAADRSPSVGEERPLDQVHPQHQHLPLGLHEAADGVWRVSFPRPQQLRPVPHAAPDRPHRPQARRRGRAQDPRAETEEGAGAARATSPRGVRGRGSGLVFLLLLPVCGAPAVDLCEQGGGSQDGRPYGRLPYPARPRLRRRLPPHRGGAGGVRAGGTCPCRAARKAGRCPGGSDRTSEGGGKHCAVRAGVRCCAGSIS
mmetsp:Transcript_34776/g.108861  ORF Transcript_34776/g.108861 Transcript_34776/m.108861 type:complete len:201 (+) Transcript_34776:170-772(+)